MDGTATKAPDPSVADYRATSPYEWGGVRYSRSRASRTKASMSASVICSSDGTQRVA
jgi:hypothetical protein